MIAITFYKYFVPTGLSFEQQLRLVLPPKGQLDD